MILIASTSWIFQAQSCELMWDEWVSEDELVNAEAHWGVLLSAPLNMSYALALHIVVLGTYWLCIRPAQTGVCGRPELCERRTVIKTRKRVKGRTHFVHTLVSIFGNSSMQVSECVSMNKPHFMHEYRDISVWIIVLAFDRKLQSRREREREREESTGQREKEGGGWG